jgi:CspA family cold shock protein
VRGRIKVLKRAQPGAARKGSGYGFITDEAGVDRFFPHSNVEGTRFDQLQEGLEVEFEAYEEPGRGQRARRVRVAG